MTITSVEDGRIFDRSGGGVDWTVKDELIIYPKNGDKAHQIQYMFVSRFGIQNERTDHKLCQ
ncbi:hypothetical protein OK016_00395 [Vibrio chagasii]|nr:hypothetical protein [Vibrio chagasii]